MSRLVFVSGMKGAPWGGSEILWSETAGRLLESGHTVMSCVPWWPELAAPLSGLRQRGVILERYGRPATLWQRGYRKLSRPFFGAIDNSASWKRVLGFRPDIVCISHGGTACGLEWMLKCREANIPYVSICQANFEGWWPSDERAEQVRKAYRGCLKAYFVSNRNKQLFESQIGESLEHGEVIRNPFNVSYDASQHWPVDTSVLRLACVGRLDPAAKGPDLIVGVLSATKWRQRPIHVSLYGSGPCLDSLRRLVAAHRLESSVTFNGHVSDVESIWKGHHALLLPSRYEGLPLAIVEAMLCGRFGIVTDVAGNAELLTDNVSGFVAQAPTVELLDDAMERAWARRDEWEQISQLASRSIREQVPRDPAAVFAEKLIGLAKSVER